MGREAKAMHWSIAFETGIASFDAEHKEIIELLSRLERTVKAVDSGDAREVLQLIQCHIQDHFAAEEKLLELHEYPGVKKQSTDHTRILRQVALICRNPDPVEAGRNLLARATELFYDHIHDIDRAYGEFLISKGVS